MTKIKICGIRRIQDAEYLNEFMPDYAGFILSKPFWRCIEKDHLEQVSAVLSPEIKRVGVFVNENLEYIKKFAPLLDVIQLHGDEENDLIVDLKNNTDCEVWKAVRVRTVDEIEQACKLSADKLLIDSYSEETYGGSGKVANWDIIKQADITKPFFLAGGISSSNCIEAIESVKPYGLDISSSVETDKVKDREKIKEIIKTVKSFIKNEEFITPPDHINFLAKSLFGKCEVTDISLAYLDKDGGGPLNKHTHKHDHFFIVTKGECKIILNNETVILKENESFLVKGKIPHSVWNNINEKTTMIGINIMPK